MISHSWNNYSPPHFVRPGPVKGGYRRVTLCRGADRSLQWFPPFFFGHVHFHFCWIFPIFESLWAFWSVSTPTSCFLNHSLRCWSNLESCCSLAIWVLTCFKYPCVGHVIICHLCVSEFPTSPWTPAPRRPVAFVASLSGGDLPPRSEVWNGVEIGGEGNVEPGGKWEIDSMTVHEFSSILLVKWCHIWWGFSIRSTHSILSQQGRRFRSATNGDDNLQIKVDMS